MRKGSVAGTSAVGSVSRYVTSMPVRTNQCDERARALTGTILAFRLAHQLASHPLFIRRRMSSRQPPLHQPQQRRHYCSRCLYPHRASYAPSASGPAAIAAATGIYVNDILEAVPIDKYFELFKPNAGGEGGFIRIRMNFARDLAGLDAPRQGEAGEEHA